MKIGPSIYASLVMTVCACYALWRGEKEFSYDQQLEVRIHKISNHLMEEKIKSEMVLARLNDFKQEVALHLPNQKQLVENPSLRDLASVIPHSFDSKTQELKSQHSFKVAKVAFEEGHYDEATRLFLDLVSQYPDSLAHLEACYYLVRTFYITGNKQESLNWSEKMLSQFPESLWTAKSLLVVAHIYRDQKRKNDALDVYQTLLNTFKDQDIQMDVKKQLAEMGI